MCFVRFDDCENDLLQTVHVNGFSPVCVLMCCVRSDDFMNDLQHTVHVYGFSPV